MSLPDTWGAKRHDTFARPVRSGLEDPRYLKSRIDVFKARCGPLSIREGTFVVRPRAVEIRQSSPICATVLCGRRRASLPRTRRVWSASPSKPAAPDPGRKERLNPFEPCAAHQLSAAHRLRRTSGKRPAPWVKGARRYRARAGYCSNVAPYTRGRCVCRVELIEAK